MSSTPTVAWRALLPPFLTEPWRRFHSGAEDPVRRFGFGVAVVDRLGRYLVAVFSAAADPPVRTRAKAYGQLLDRLDKATLGNWWTAAAELAVLVPQDGGPVAQAAAAIRQGPVRDALVTLIDERNRAAHRSDGGVGLDRTEAEQRLESFRPALERCCDAFAVLADARLCTFKQRPIGPDQKRVIEVVQFRATDPELQAIRQEVFALKPEAAWLVEPSGRALRLDPWIRVATDHVAGPTPFLLDRVDQGGPVWVAHDRSVRSEWPWPWYDPSTASVEARRVGAGVDPPLARRLCGMGEDLGSPKVPGWLVGGLRGRGATCAVWVGTREGAPGRHFALKVLHGALSSAPEIGHRLRLEAEVGRKLSHPNLVAVDGVFDLDDGRIVIVQELVDGPTLEDRFHDDPPPSISALVGLVRGVAQALAHLHANGVLHRDVKPANVLVDANGAARLADLGLAAVEADHRLTRTHQGLGTPAFAAPEQLRGVQADARADVYGLGRVLEEGLRALYGPKLVDAPPRLRGIVARATKVDPAERFATAEEMRQALDASDLLEDVCPLGHGDALGGKVRIEGAGRRLKGVEPAVWELTARDASGTECFVAIGAEGPAGDWVRATAKRLPVPCQSEGGFVFAVVPKGWRQAQQKSSEPDRGTMIGVGGLLLGAAGLLAGGAVAATAAAAAASSARRATTAPAPRATDPVPAPPPSNPPRAPSATPPPAPAPKAGPQPSRSYKLGQLLARAALRSAVGPAATSIEAAAKAKKGPKKD